MKGIHSLSQFIRPGQYDGCFLGKGELGTDPNGVNCPIIRLFGGKGDREVCIRELITRRFVPGMRKGRVMGRVSKGGTGGRCRGLR